MQKIISIELQKIKPYAIFWVIVGIVAGLFLMVAIASSSFDSFLRSMLGSNMEGFDLQNYFRFPDIWQTFSWIAGWFGLVLLPLVIIVLIGNEYSFRTFRQNIISGLSRTELMLGKLFIVFLVSAGAMVFLFLVTFIFGLVYSKDLSLPVMLDKSYFLLLAFLQTFLYLSFAMMLAHLLKNTVLSIIVYYAYLIFELIMRLYFNIVESNAYQYFPVKIANNMIPLPSFKIAMDPNLQNQMQAMPDQVDPLAPPPIWIAIIVSLVFIAFFNFMSYRLVKTRNL